ncbi:hypothetical protein AWM75_00890 [Aerococcus urinaehominis]|uniref:Uncharacterized protein n=3 Tax=Aerococcus urinaehominis TaxID=128944 RepID=A0A109RG59_9LACT|nr:hypothetical protein AWM75_00890 [Aerococcus urinaehominis]
MAEGRLRIASGLTDISAQTAGNFMIEIDEQKRETCDYLINATGFQLNLEIASQTDPLIKNLLAKDWIQPADQETGQGVMVNWPTCQIINQSYGMMPHLYCLGHYIHLTQYGNNNAQLNLKQGRRSAEHLMNQIR